MATLQTWTIGSGGDYTDFPAWYAAQLGSPVSLVALDQVWKLVFLNQVHDWTLGANGALVLSVLDITATDSTRYLWITGDPDTWHKGRPGVGPRIIISSDMGAGDDIIGIFQINHTLVEKLELSYTGSATDDGSSSSACKMNGDEMKQRHLLVHDINISSRNRGISQLPPGGGATGGDICNNIVYNIGEGTVSADSSGIRMEGDDKRIYNNTVYNVDSWGIEMTSWNASDTNYARNNMAFGCGVADFIFQAGSGTNDVAYCLSGDLTADGAGGTGNQTGITAADQFVSIAGENFHLKAGADAILAGTNLGAGVWDTDIDGVTRRTNGNWDIGADQRAADTSLVTEIVAQF